ncbi:hypothetical protein C5745_07865 [Sphingobacterium haloxyli]|uniref:FAS1 domain-containing protein n=2 Tax=Sphingobacterium haloxyli TaxID=2100533 RepID=A0A2S9J4V5_9SPHI|nr:hypothetical protein C5745_07865 [Sphingobacterium haloxyli]
MPEPLGEPIPQENYPSLREVLSSSNEYTLFRAAWERGAMERVVTEEYSQSKLLFLVPNDEAMKTAGYTLEIINATDIADLEVFLRYHVLNNHMTREHLRESASALAFNSLLIHPELQEGVQSASIMIAAPYCYQHTLQLVGEDQLIDNGVLVSTADWIPVDNGTIVPLDQVIERPTNQMIDVLREDGRFSLFVRAMELNGLLYDAYTVSNLSPPIFPPYKYITDWYAVTEGGFRSQELLPHVIRFTLFAPTDAAFQEIGIHTEEDLRLLNARSQVRFGNNASTPSDSLLVTHRISRSRVEMDIDWVAFVPGISVIAHSKGANAVFYDRSLNNGTLGNYVIESTVNFPIYLDYDFGADASGRVTVKQRGSAAEPATVIESNINTFQGPIHVVDRLIVPKDFSMWHVK